MAFSRTPGGGSLHFGVLRFAHQNDRNARFSAFPDDFVQRPHRTAGCVPNYETLLSALFLHLGRNTVTAKQNDTALFRFLCPFDGNDSFFPKRSDGFRVVDQFAQGIAL